jgi:Na+-driven multidrug efflux pump
VVFYNVISALVLLAEVRGKSSLFRAGWRSVWPQRHVSGLILRVAIPSSVNTLQSNLTFLALTALVAPFGTSAIAGYGMSGRLEFLLIPIVFGVGSALIPLVGANLAAGNHHRARQATRAGLFLGSAAGAAIGLTAACFPDHWMNLFTGETAVTDVGRRYLQVVGPCYFAFGGGLVLFFAAQGRGRVLSSLFAGFTRLIVAAVGGYVVTRQLNLGLDALFGAMATGLLSYGGVMLFVTRKQL